MKPKSRPRTSSALLLILLATLAAVVTAAEKTADRGPMSAREKALHALNRLGFGPRPGEVDRVAAMGVSAWMEKQLRPDSIPDPDLAGRLEGMPTLSMSSREIFETFEKPLREARRQRKEKAAAQGDVGQGLDASAQTAEEGLRQSIPPEKRPRRVVEELSAARVIRAAYSERQANELLVDFWMNHFNVFAAKGLDRVFIGSFERDVVRPRIWGKFEDLLLATAKAPAMLFYLDNAQSVSAPENRPAERRAFASAARRWPLAGPRVVDPMLERQAAPRKGGLNENYARELMELHTLGVDGGYTQKDVTELARILTGWSIEREGGEFVFRERAHDVGTKTFLGHTFAGSGMDEGEQAIRMLARHPSTAQHIAFQLCQRLVADEPPAALVDRVAKRFLATDGDLRETVRAVVTSPEFFAPEAYRAKVKSPFEYVVSAIRASGASTDARAPILRELAKMGEPLYLCQPPTGYADVSSAWVSSGSLVERLNFAVAFASNRIPGTTVDLAGLAPEAEPGMARSSVDALARRLLGAGLSDATAKTIEARMAVESGATEVAGSLPLAGGPHGSLPLAAGADHSLALAAGLILGSPEFQRQ